MHSASDVARWFLINQDETTGERISNLKLQKLCYYAQALHLALHGVPLFRDPVKAWPHGPVVPSLWHEYKENAYYSIPIPEGIDESGLSETAQDVLNIVRNTYAMQTATTLRAMTHEEPPGETHGNATAPSSRRARWRPTSSATSCPSSRLRGVPGRLRSGRWLRFCKTTMLLPSGQR